MTAVRLLVGTRKGAFILTADGARQDWRVAGPFFAGWEIYHVKPIDAHTASMMVIPKVIDTPPRVMVSGVLTDP